MYSNLLISEGSVGNGLIFAPPRINTPPPPSLKNPTLRRPRSWIRWKYERKWSAGAAGRWVFLIQGGRFPWWVCLIQGFVLIRGMVARGG